MGENWVEILIFKQQKPDLDENREGALLHRNMKLNFLLNGFILGLFSFIFSQASTQAAAPSSPDSTLLRAVADDIDSLLADTVDEGSWNADVSRDEQGNPVEAACQPIENSQDQYRCSLAFILTPYEGEDLGDEPWGGYCDELIYEARRSSNGNWRVTRASEAGILDCLDQLNSGP